MKFKSTDRLFVIAGTAGQALEYVREHAEEITAAGLDPKLAFYTFESRQLLGFEAQPYVKVGTWFENSQADEIDSMLKPMRFIPFEHTT